MTDFPEATSSYSAVEASGQGLSRWIVGLLSDPRKMPHGRGAYKEVYLCRYPQGIIYRTTVHRYLRLTHDPSQSYESHWIAN